MSLYLRNIAWFFIVFIGFEALGLREQGASGLGNQSAGFYGILQLVFLLMLFISPVIYITYLSKIRIFDHLSLSIHLIFLLFIIELLLGIVFSGGYPIPKLLYNFYSLKYYLIFFFITVWYKDLTSLKNLVNVLSVASVIAAIIFLVFAFVYQFPSVIQKVTTDQAGRELRYLVPMGMLMTFGLCYQLSNMIYQGITATRLATTAILFAGVFMQLHRNVHLGMLVVFLMVGHKIFLSRRKRWIRLAVYGVVGIAIAVYVQNLMANSESVVSRSVQEVTSDNGGIGIRMAVLANSVAYVVGNAPFLGIGFVWQDFDIYTILDDLFVLAPTNDNAYTNVLLCFGFTGLLLFGYLLFAMFRALNKLKEVPGKNVQVIRYTTLLTLVFILISGFGSDNFIAYNSVIIFVILIALLNNLNLFVHERSVS